MNILSWIATMAIAAETVVSPTVSFASLTSAVSGTGTFRATIVAGLSAVKEVPMTKKSTVTIALLGDSMIDTLGADPGEMRDELVRAYPKTIFTFMNYGVGGENIVSGLARITGQTVYLGNVRPPLITTHPDVIVVESFAYNPFSFEVGALDHHWESLAFIMDAIRANLPDTKVVIAATIAPNSRVFGDGASGISFSIQDKRERTNTIKAYLENAIRFAQSQHLPLADAYHPSLEVSGEGKLMYINPGDHIHYSDAGRLLFARTVAEALVQNKLLE